MRRLSLAALMGWGAASAFGACASGSNIETGAGGGSTGAGGGSGGGTVGAPCDQQQDCPTGTKCTLVGTSKICTTACPPACPSGSYCALVAGESVCLPEGNDQCLPCKTVLQCKEASDACLTAPLGDYFCARDCTTLGDCPNGFTCMTKEQYADVGLGGSGGGSTTSGSGGSMTKPPAGQPYKFCVPNSGASCPCTDARNGVTRACTRENGYGTCTGLEVCDGKTTAWTGCTASAPAVETCNGKDDNCDGNVDEGDPNMLCMSAGSPPPHATWACTNGMCATGACDAGWANYPPGPTSAGCTCTVEMGEPNDTCATAHNAGSVSDASSAPLTFGGTLSSDKDVDVWKFQTTDTDETTTNSYHVSITFAAPAPNNEFVFDVIRGSTCSDTPSGATTNVTSYTWCVDGTSADGMTGEGTCGPTAPVHCSDSSSLYFVRVHRKAGVTGTCTQYSISVTAKGGAACDFTQKCM